MKKLAILSVCLLMAGVSFARTDADSTAAKTDQPTQDVITQPEFRGGIEKMYQYISDNFEYPEDAAKRSVNGKMDVEFTVEKSGDITYVG